MCLCVYVLGVYLFYMCFICVLCVFIYDHGARADEAHAERGAWGGLTPHPVAIRRHPDWRSHVLPVGVQAPGFLF
jgi:hypothetical protein